MVTDALQIPTEIRPPLSPRNGPKLPPPVQPRHMEQDSSNLAMLAQASNERRSPTSTTDTEQVANEPSKSPQNNSAAALPLIQADGAAQRVTASPEVNGPGTSFAIGSENSPPSYSSPAPLSSAATMSQSTGQAPAAQDRPPHTAHGVSISSSANASTQNPVLQGPVQSISAQATVGDVSPSAETAAIQQNGNDASLTQTQGSVSPKARRVMPIAPAPSSGRNLQSPPTSVAKGPGSVSSTPTQSPDQGPSRPTQEEHECANCKTTKTPLWRRGPNGQNLCNACGLYVKARNINRPVTLKRSPVTRVVPLQMGSCPGDGRCNGTGGSESCPQCPSFNNNRLLQAQQEGDGSTVNMVSCQNCGTVTTPLWRRDAQGHIICNACGLYNRIHKDSRPTDLRTSLIKRRRRNTRTSSQEFGADEALRGSLRASESANSSQSPVTPSQPYKLSQPPSPEGSPGHSSADGNDLCCTHVSPALQPQYQYSVPMYGAQGQAPLTSGQPNQQGQMGHPQPPPPPQGPLQQGQKPGGLPLGYVPMGQNGPIGLPMMISPGTGYHPWPVPSQMGPGYPYPQQMPIPGQGPPPMVHPQHQTSLPIGASPLLGAQPAGVPQGTSHGRLPPAQTAPASSAQHASPSHPQQPQQLQPQQHFVGQLPAQAGSNTSTPQPAAPQEEVQHSSSTNSGQSAHSNVEGASSAVAFTRSSKQSDESSVPEKLKRRGSGSADHSDSPLAVLQYLRGASQDTISEYLLAAQRQLNDKVYQLRGRLSRAEFQLKECEDALKEINK